MLGRRNVVLPCNAQAQMLDGRCGFVLIHCHHVDVEILVLAGVQVLVGGICWVKAPGAGLAIEVEASWCSAGMTILVNQLVMDHSLMVNILTLDLASQAIIAVFADCLDRR